ncbi:MAG: hypothetical protein K2Q25_02360 [Mycobacteriaceae bacterium]|nr:hypothetical protein [Mycobacteriaceae bacterium]
MFVVAPVIRAFRNPEDPKQDELLLSWPVVFEDLQQGFASGALAQRDSRAAAQKLANALNRALAAN